MKVFCNHCNSEFELSKEEDERYEFFISKGWDDIVTPCTICKKSVRIQLIEKDQVLNFRCPVSQCSGWVNYIEDGFEGAPFWGCGECGSRWKNQKSMFAEIVRIVKRYPYRKTCYEKISKSNCIPAGLSKEIEGYDEKVIDEKEDNRNEKSDSYYRD